jgi:hypothetical protein
LCQQQDRILQRGGEQYRQNEQHQSNAGPANNRPASGRVPRALSRSIATPADVCSAGNKSSCSSESRSGSFLRRYCSHTLIASRFNQPANASVRCR